MQDRLEALKILGLSEEAQRNDIENRYFQLMKRYKQLPHDEQPSIGEPIFAVINQAYRFLIGYAPLQKIQFKELTWKEKLQHIQEYYLIQIILGVVSIVVVLGIGWVVHDINKAMQAETTSSSSVTSTGTGISPSPGLECKCPQRALR